LKLTNHYEVVDQQLKSQQLYQRHTTVQF